MPEPVESVEEFFAHALAIEDEAARRYRDFQEHFADRDEEVLAGLCGKLAQFEQDHYTRLAERSKPLRLPELAPDRYRWLESGPPECADHALVYRVASPRQLLEIALRAERDARRFFEWVSGATANGEIHVLAEDMAREEAEHAQWVSGALDRLCADGVDWNELLAAGGGPGLALGGERRVSRDERPEGAAGASRRNPG